MTESLREENLPPGGSLRGLPKTSERSPFVTQSSLPVYLLEVFGGPLRDPLGGHFLLETLGPVTPNRVAPSSFPKFLRKLSAVFAFRAVIASGLRSAIAGAMSSCLPSHIFSHDQAHNRWKIELLNYVPASCRATAQTSTLGTTLVLKVNCSQTSCILKGEAAPSGNFQGRFSKCGLLPRIPVCGPLSFKTFRFVPSPCESACFKECP